MDGLVSKMQAPKYDAWESKSCASPAEESSPRTD